MGRPYFEWNISSTGSRTIAEHPRCTQRLEYSCSLPCNEQPIKGVIHRDIKPSNVLIWTEEGRPVPKVIDFGVAKAIGGQLGENKHMTQVGQFVGTPEYMSPEQAGPASYDVDTRSDVYSLGVLLYELLTGHPPFVSRVRLGELRRGSGRTLPRQQRARAALGAEGAKSQRRRTIRPPCAPACGDLD